MCVFPICDVKGRSASDFGLIFFYPLPFGLNPFIQFFFSYFLTCEFEIFFSLVFLSCFEEIWGILKTCVDLRVDSGEHLISR